MKRKRLDPIKGTESDFAGTLEQWDDSVFLNAIKFRLHKYIGRKRYEAETTDFAQAMIAATEAVSEGHRMIVYAITATGRYQALVPQRWDHYAKLWLERRNGSK